MMDASHKPKALSQLRQGLSQEQTGICSQHRQGHRPQMSAWALGVGRSAQSRQTAPREGRGCPAVKEETRASGPEDGGQGIKS